MKNSKFSILGLQEMGVEEMKVRDGGDLSEIANGAFMLVFGITDIAFAPFINMGYAIISTLSEYIRPSKPYLF